jgi:dolichol kinase
MNDLALGGIWLGVLGAGIAGCVIAHGLGLASTYVRDVLHIGAGIWILGWPYWHGGAVPLAIVACVAAATAALPFVAGKSRLAAKLVRSVTNGDEHWIGLVHYTAMYASFTALALVIDPFPAAAALLALSLGDGIGGAVGRNLGRHHYQVPGGKRKSLEGSLVVLLAAAAGAALAAQLFGRDIGLAALLVLGAVASLVEAIAPRSTDNLLIPIAVWTTATLVT